MAVKVKYWTDSSGQLAVDIKGIETTAIPPIACYGDSLTAGSGSSFNKEYPYILGTLLGNREVINRGVGGQHAPEIVCRTGTAAPLLTLSGNALPEAAAVALTEVSVDFLRLPKAGDTQIDGYLAGIAATVYATTVIESGTKTVNYSVQRAVAVDTGSVDIPPNTPFLVDAQGANKDYIPVIWVGRNDLSRARNKVDVEASDKVDDIISYIARAVDHLRPDDEPFAVLSVPGYDDAAEYVGTDVYNERARLNKYLAERYADNFVDVAGLLLLNGNGGAQDLTDIANGITPSSLRSDVVHLNDAGYALVANAVAALFLRRGW